MDNSEIRRVFHSAPFIADMGLALDHASEGECRTSLVVLHRHLQQDGFVHAGVQATMADHTAGAAAATVLSAGRLVLTAEFKINLLRPARGELLTCVATVLKSGSTLIVVESEVSCGSGGEARLVSKATVTLAVVYRTDNPPPESDRQVTEAIDVEDGAPSDTTEPLLQQGGGSGSIGMTRFDDLLLGFDWVNGGESAGIDAEVYVNRNTGAIVWVGEGAEEEPPDDIHDATIYAQLPLQRDLDLGREVVRDFVEHRMPDAHDEVTGMFRRRGAYSRFKSFLERLGRLDEWHAYENSAVEMALFNWCKENGITLDRPPDRGAGPR